MKPERVNLTKQISRNGKCQSHMFSLFYNPAIIIYGCTPCEKALVEFASSAELLSHLKSSSFVYGYHEKEGQILQTCLFKDVISLLYILKGNFFYLMILV